MELNLNGRILTYKKTGAGSSTVILIPGGPGFTYDSLAIIHSMLPENEFTVISYNPSGVGKNEAAPFYKSVSAYAHELERVIKTLNLKNIFLLGHSWGTAIAQEYLARYPNEPLKGIILVNAFSSGDRLAKAIKGKAATLPPSFQERYKKILASGDGDELDALIGEYWLPQFACRLQKLPQDIIAAVAFFRDAPMNYYYIGSNLFELNGALLAWNRLNNLSQIKVPTLVMSGEYDYASKTEVEELVKLIPGAQLWYESGVSHFPMYEKTEAFRESLFRFLKANL